MSFKAGDAVWARSDGWAVPAGWYAAVVLGSNAEWVSTSGDHVYTVYVFDHPRPLWAAPTHGLRPRWNDGDSSARGAWSGIPWKPSERRREPLRHSYCVQPYDCPNCREQGGARA